MFTTNQVLVQGYVGRITDRNGEILENPVVRRTTGGKAVCNFSLATTERWKSDGVAQEKTTWHQITCWEEAAERAGQFLKQGKYVSVQGRLENRQYTGGDGTKNRVSEIVCRQLDLGPDKGWRGAPDPTEVTEPNEPQQAAPTSSEASQAASEEA
jgi:single-strand DNA-binding protein